MFYIGLHGRNCAKRKGSVFTDVVSRLYENGSNLAVKLLLQRMHNAGFVLRFPPSSKVS